MGMMRAVIALLGLISLVGQAVGAPATAPSTRPAAWYREVSIAQPQIKSGMAVRITVKARGDVTGVTLLYQVVEPGAYVELGDPEYKTGWVSVAMKKDASARDGAVFYGLVPATAQKHRRLVRYRLEAVDATGQKHQAPLASAPTPNFAYFVYDGVPGWAGAIDPKSNDPKLKTPMSFTPAAMQKVQAYHFLGKKTSIENVTWKEQTGGKEYKYTGTLVANGVVYDHVRYRARGGVWRYAMGKNMWKFDFPEDEKLEAVDDFGRGYATAWSKLNLRPCIQLGSYGRRGEQGMYEAVGFRLFNLAGVAAPRTHWVDLRIIDEPVEAPANQYQGDFWGLYLAIENEDGRFLKEHGLPDGNLYKMAGGSGELGHQGEGQGADKSDLIAFMASYNGGDRNEAWWRKNLNLGAYYSYRSIVECIHHYDIGEGKNYDYFHNPATGQWQVIPWDLDLTWADHMYGNGEEPFKGRVLGKRELSIEYQNRLREIRDLLFNPEQTGRIIDEYAAVISDPTGRPGIAEADRRKWDFHPALAGGGQAGNGLYYQASSTKDFAGMVKLMKDWVKGRGEWIDANLIRDEKVPGVGVAAYSGAGGFAAGKLKFKASAYKGANAFTAMKWRMAEVAPAGVAAFLARGRDLFEINAVWESLEMEKFGEEVVIPAGVAKAGHTYRVRVRFKDATGRWGHWSLPVEFVAR
jgi:hypothetical protein